MWPSSSGSSARRRTRAAHAHDTAFAWRPERRRPRWRLGRVLFALLVLGAGVEVARRYVAEPAFEPRVTALKARSDASEQRASTASVVPTASPGDDESHASHTAVEAAAVGLAPRASGEAIATAPEATAEPPPVMPKVERVPKRKYAKKRRGQDHASHMRRRRVHRDYAFDDAYRMFPPPAYPFRYRGREYRD